MKASISQIDAQGHFVPVFFARFLKSRLEVQSFRGAVKPEPSILHFLSLSAGAVKPDTIDIQHYQCRWLFFFVFLDYFLSRGLESGLQGEGNSFDDIPLV